MTDEKATVVDPRVVIALDFPAADAALAFARRVSPHECRLKIGKELFTVTGPALVETLSKQGFAIFLDLKFHDIPNTVASACRAAANLGVWMINVHACGGRAMMAAAREAVGSGGDRPRLIAVTLLTSMGPREIEEIGLIGDAPAVVGRLARLAQSSGLDGVVCSAQEAAMLRRDCGNSFCLVTPGIRPAAAAANDQQRIMTPAAAAAAGADYLVIGRPITQAADPAAALAAINLEIGTGKSA
jgi:orotidine-5'-phosphate decarboxylase